MGGRPVKILSVTSRSLSVLLDEEGHFNARNKAALYLNGAFVREEDRSVATLFGLTPGTAYALRAVFPDREETVDFTTDTESVSFSVRRFGAVGDGKKDDTAALQAAIACCPPRGRVVISAGKYVTGPLFLKSHMTLEIKENAELLLKTDREAFPILPGVTFTRDGEYCLGSFEGNPLDSYASCLNLIGVEDVRLLGPGTVDGRAGEGDWWQDPKVRRGAWRGHLMYTKDSKNILTEGITFRNSPCWNLHPSFSKNLTFLSLRIEAPSNSPNTDGFDPQSCDGVRMLGTLFAVGDDCIAIKSGKIYMGMKYHVPCENVEIAYCAMLYGHGGVTVGSEMAGGVRHVRVHHCLMRGNDRGLRIKTRRGRGRNGVIDDIRFEDVVMEGVKAPLVVNSLYYCDPDGHSPWVQSRKKEKADDSTPTVGSIVYERVTARDCAACAAYILGLPERPVKSVVMKDCAFFFLPDAAPFLPVMADGAEPVHNRGVIVSGVEKLELDHVTMEGISGPREEQL